MEVAQVKQVGEVRVVPGWLAAYWPYMVAALSALVVKLPTLTNSIIFIDEPAYLNQARLIDSPQAFVFSFLYRSETKFPLGLVPHMVAQAISQPNAILIVRLFGLAAVIYSAWLLLSISQRLFSGYAPGFFAFAVWAIFQNRNEATVVPLLEYFQAPLLLLSFWLFIRVVQEDRGRGSRMFWTGILVALATLVKQPALLVAPVFLVGLWLMVGREQPRRATLRQAGLFLLGLFIPLALAIVPYFFRADAMSELIFNMFTVTATYATTKGESIVGRIGEMMRIFGPVNLALFVLTAVFFALTRLTRYGGEKWGRTHSYQVLLLATGGALFAGYLAGQTKDHYLIPVIPFAMLFVGRELVTWHARMSRHTLQLALVTVVAVALAVAGAGSVYYYLSLFGDGGKTYAQLLPGVDANALANYIKAHSGPQDRLWVYYNAPEVYWLADRRPATNEPVGTWLVDYYDTFWFTRTANELERDRPAIIVGLDKPRYPRVQAGPLLRLPVISAMIERDYSCSNTAVAQTVICTRKATAP